MTEENECARPAEQPAAGSGAGRRASARIAGVLRDRVHEGVLKAGERMPTQAALAREFGVERGAVRQAMQSLRAEGFLGPARRGVPPRVTRPRRDATPQDPATREPRGTLVALGPRLVRAFEERAVRIDVLTLTAESLIPAVSEAVIAVHHGTLRPGSVTARILLPSRSTRLAFPAAVAEAEREAVRGRWLRMRDAQARVLRRALTGLGHSHGVEVSVEFRTVPFTPPVKLYLLNGAEALFAYYLVARSEDGADGLPGMFDTWGTQARLFRFETAPGGRDAAFVGEAHDWFESLWTTISEPLILEE